MTEKKVVAEYLPTKVHKNMPEFLKHRKLTIVSGSVAKRKAQKVIKTDQGRKFLPQDTFEKAVQMDGYVIIEAEDLPEKDRRFRKQVSEINRKRKTRTFIVIIDMGSRYSNQSPEFVTLMKRLPGFDHDKRDYNIDIIVISQNSLSSHIMKKINLYTNYGTDLAGFTHIEAHQYYVFYINIMDPNNAFIPQHRIISREEEDVILNSIYSDKKEMPRIHQSDPPVVWIGGEVGDIIEIIQLSEAAGLQIAYRVVVPIKH